MAEWLKAGAQIPDDPELEVDLTSPQYGYSSKQQIQLEKKEDMKSRGLASPDLGDCCAMTFAVQPMIRKTAPLRNLSYEFPSTSGQGWMMY
jgi:hypothetical protein